MFRLFAAAAILALTATAAQAAPVQVSFKDLNLANPAEARVLEGRLAAAAEQVCGPVVIPADNRPSVQTAMESNHKSCVRLVSARALAQVRAVQAQLAATPQAKLARQ